MAPPKKTQTPIKKKTPKKKSIKKKIKASKPSLFVILGKIFLGLSIWGAFGVGLIFLWFSKDFPSLDNLDKAIRQPSITFQSRDGYIIGTYGDLYEEVLSIDKLPPYVPQALMAVEDRRVYYNFGGASLKQQIAASNEKFRKLC